MHVTMDRRPLAPPQVVTTRGQNVEYVNGTTSYSDDDYDEHFKSDVYIVLYLVLSRAPQKRSKQSSF